MIELGIFKLDYKNLKEGDNVEHKLVFKDDKDNTLTIKACGQGDYDRYEKGDPLELEWVRQQGTLTP